MNSARSKLLKSDSVEEKIAGIFIMQKDLESLSDEAQRFDLISETMSAVTPTFLFQMSISKISIVKKNGIYMLLYMTETNFFSKLLLTYLDIIILITSAEKNSELKMCLHSICQNISHLCIDEDMSKILEKVMVYLLHQEQEQSKDEDKDENSSQWTSTAVAYYDPVAVLEVCLQTCIMFHFKASDFKGHSWCKLLRTVIMVHLNASRMKGEEQFDKWLILVLSYLKYSPTMQWTLEQEHGSLTDLTDSGTTATKCATADRFSMYIMSVVTTEMHLVLEELLCVYMEEREHVYAIKQHKLSKENEPIQARYTRALRIFLILCDYLDRFLELLVSTSHGEVSNDSDSDSDYTKFVTCWGDLPYDVLLKMQSTIHGIAKESFQFVVDLEKVWTARQSDITATIATTVDVGVWQTVQSEYAMIVSRVTDSLCKWGRDDERIQKGMLLRLKHMVAFSSIYQSGSMLMKTTSKQDSNDADTMKALDQCKDRVLAALQGVNDSTGMYSNSSSGVASGPGFAASGGENGLLVELYDHCFTTVDDTTVMKHYGAQDVFVHLALFLADVLTEKQTLDTAERKKRSTDLSGGGGGSNGAAARKKGKFTSEVGVLLETLSLNSEHFVYHLVLLCHCAVRCVSTIASAVTKANKNYLVSSMKSSSDYGSCVEEEELSACLHTHASLLGRVGSIVQLLADICIFYEPFLETLIKGERNIALSVDSIFNNNNTTTTTNTNSHGNPEGLFKHFRLLFHSLLRSNKLAIQMSKDARPAVDSTVVNNVVSKNQPLVPNTTNTTTVDSSAGPNESYMQAVEEYQDSLLDLRRNYTKVMNFCKGVLAIGIK